jgi:hypothetical protein
MFQDQENLYRSIEVVKGCTMSSTEISVNPRQILPVDIVLAPAWWHANTGITFDEDFFFHPARRVEAERMMENTLRERWGTYGIGEDAGQAVPLIGPVHLAAGFVVSGMLGCEIEYHEAAPPDVRCAALPALDAGLPPPFTSPMYRKVESLLDRLKERHGRLVGDLNWSGVLNVALDLRGESVFSDMRDDPPAAASFMAGIAAVLDEMTRRVHAATGSTSISVNRNVRNIRQPVFLHSECSLTMISTADYEQFLMPIDARWSGERRPFGIHYCGADPHRFAPAFSRLPHLDFLDVGWGGDVRLIRGHLPATFLNLRLSPVRMISWSPDEVRATVRRLVADSGDPALTGICCINMDEKVPDANISAMFETVRQLREQAVRG